MLSRDADAAVRIERRSVARAVAPPHDYGKRIFDLAGALLLGILLSPFILVISALIRLEGLPVLFWHKRIGRGGKVFYCLKFRTMAVNASKSFAICSRRIRKCGMSGHRIISCATIRELPRWTVSTQDQPG